MCSRPESVFTRPTPNDEVRCEGRHEHGGSARQRRGRDADCAASRVRGQPERIKRILMKTATDLGRERYFQGAGMVDALRALQSV